jgi:hypothetical protein
MGKEKVLKGKQHCVTYKTIEIVDCKVVNGERYYIEYQQVTVLVDRKYKYTMRCEIAEIPYITANAQERAWRLEFIRQFSLDLLEEAEVVEYKDIITEYHISLMRLKGDYFRVWELDFATADTCEQHDTLEFDKGGGFYGQDRSFFERDSVAIESIEQIDKKSLLAGICYKISLTPYQVKVLAKKYFYYG